MSASLWLYPLKREQTVTPKTELGLRYNRQISEYSESYPPATVKMILKDGDDVIGNDDNGRCLVVLEPVDRITTSCTLGPHVSPWDVARRRAASGSGSAPNSGGNRRLGAGTPGGLAEPPWLIIQSSQLVCLIRRELTNLSVSSLGVERSEPEQRLSASEAGGGSPPSQTGFRQSWRRSGETKPLA